MSAKRRPITRRTVLRGVGALVGLPWLEAMRPAPSALAGEAGDDGSHDDDPGEPIPEGAGIEARPRPVRSEACMIPATQPRERWAAEDATGWGVRLGMHLVKGIGEQHQGVIDAELARGPYRSLAEVVDRTGLPEEVIERLIRAGALDSLGRPRRELLWQLREVAGAERGRVGGRSQRRGCHPRCGGRPARLTAPGRRAASSGTDGLSPHNAPDRTFARYVHTRRPVAPGASPHTRTPAVGAGHPSDTARPDAGRRAESDRGEGQRTARARGSVRRHHRRGLRTVRCGSSRSVDI